ncbi:pickpocket protein 28-like isoform X2 [Tenebrio molitor]|uniref:pickpocket protein 28-like isoform X2 n=1 Tax=Tenebrio molitor TaxID=7067 RepID=UPI00362470A7
MKRTKSLGWLQQCRDVVKNKSGHGRNFGYSTEEKRPWSSAEQLNKKRLFWFTVLCVCMYTCGSLIYLTFKRWKTNPIFISFTSKPLWEVPFPAVTVCPENQVKRRSYNYTYQESRLSNITGIEWDQFESVYAHCPRAHTQRYFSNRLVDSDGFEFFITHATSVRDILGASPDLWLVNKKHETRFAPIITDGGLCFSFNMLHQSELFTNVTYLSKYRVESEKSKHWSVDDNYDDTTEKVFPLRVTSVRKMFYFRFGTHKDDIDYNCDAEQGFKIILHHPAEIPTVLTRYILAAHHQTYSLWIRPDVSTTSSKLKEYDPHARNCLFSNERSLKYYKIYTQRNCEIECLANYTLNKCGCVSFYMPHESSTKMCGFYQEEFCVKRAAEELTRLDLEFKMSRGDVFNQNGSCDCLPSCTSITYNTEISQNMENNTSSNEYYFTQLNMRFRDGNFLVLERDALFSNTDFWASCGGLFGLFTGFSVMSLVEIIYFLFFRWICNLRNLCRQE